MYRYNLYIAKHLLHATLLVAFSLTSIAWLAQALRFIDFIVNQGVSLTLFLHLMLLLLPSLLLLILPISLFIAVLFVYNRLMADSELVVLQAVGLSRWGLARPALIVAGGTLVLGALISAWLLPLSYGKFKETQAFLRNNYVSLFLQEGIFSNPVDGLTVFVRARADDGTLRGILVHDNRQTGAPVTMMAEEGRLMETPQGPRFLLVSGNRQEMRGGRLSLLHFDSYALDISVYTQSMDTRSREPQEQFLPELFGEGDAAALEVARRRAEGHQRITWPLLSLMLPLVGLAFLLSGEFNRRGQWQRLALAVAAVAGLVLVIVSMKSLIVKQPALWPLLYLAVALPAAVAVYVLSAPARFRRHAPKEAMA